MLRRSLPMALACLFLSAALFGQSPELARTKAPSPNIIVVMSDDHAQSAISAYGSQLIRTPSIDRLAHEGIRFDSSFVTNSICAPSRAVLLTGKYSHRNGLRDNRDEFDGSQVTFPKLLQKAGYQTAIVGKWHLKTEPTGFDYWNILVAQGHYYSPELIEMGQRVQRAGYVTDVITDLALEFLDRRDKAKPFLLLYYHKAPHRNWMPDVRHLSLYKDTNLPVPETFWDEYQGREAARSQEMRVADMYLSLDMKLQAPYYGQETGRGGNDEFVAAGSWVLAYNRMTPEQKALWDAHYSPINEEFQRLRLQGKALVEWKLQRYLKDYLRCVASLDANLGRVLDYLDVHDLAQNTIVIYTSDQGFYLGEHGWYDKRFMYEESLRTPLLLRYPTEVPQGQTADALVLNLDLAPTLLDYAGLEAPSEMQGRSLRGIARGEAPPDWRDAIYYHYYEYPHGWHRVKRHYGVRTHRYKLIHFYHDIDVWELYDLETDPQELINLYGRPGYEEIQRQLHVRLQELQTQLGDESFSEPEAEREPGPGA